MDSVFDIIRKAESEYTSGKTTISEYVDFSLKDNVEKIEAYLNSKHTSGSTDSLGREKPFFNIVTAASNIWYRATDIDRANIRIKSTKSTGHTLSVIADMHSRAWMRRANFGVFLNDWGRVLARYGSAVTKWVEKDGELIATVVPWNRLIIDPVEMNNAPVIEKLYYTPAQLKKNKAYDKEQVDALIDAVTTRKTLGGTDKDTVSEFIEVYEIHGEMPLSYLTDIEEDEDTYVQQMHVCSFVLGDKGKYQDFSLLSGRSKDPYMITHLIKEDGRSMAIGAVEHLFEAQWMVNHNEKAIKDQLDLASKLIFQTSDPDFQGKNAMAMDTGTVLIHDPNQPLTQLANGSHDIGSLMNAKMDWRGQATEASSTPDAIRGITPPSGTALGTVQITTQQGLSLFELMTENKGLDIEEMWRRFVIPFLKSKMDTSEEIAVSLDDMGVKQIDSMYVPAEAVRRYNKEAVSKVITALETDNMNELPQPFDKASAEQEVMTEMKPLGNQRFFKPSEIPTATWKSVLKDLEWDVEVEVTNEGKDKQATLATLTATLQQLASLGDIQNARLVLSKILEETGIFSPMELSMAQVAPTPAAAQDPQLNQ
jgi:hypothetical protein